MSGRLLAAAIEGLARDWPSAPLVSIEVAAPSCDVVRFLRARGKEPLLLWSAPDAELDGHRWSFAGIGETARIDVSGTSRVETAKARAASLLASIEDRSEGLGPSLRIFGGVAFRPEPARTAPWSSFSDASFAIPRWLFATSSDAAFLRLTIARKDVENPRLLLEELERVDGALRCAPMLSPPRYAAPPVIAPDVGEAAAWHALVRDALARIGAHELDKVVAARSSHVVAKQAIDVPMVLDRIAREYPDSTRFAFQRGASIFVGATPERLVTLRDFVVQADALAGSTRRDPVDDDRAAFALLASDKDRREHAFVVLAIAEALGSFCEDLRVAPAPVLRTLRNVHHLWTPIAGVLRERVHVLDLVRALHPTPAVCGLPRGAALAWIAEHEPMARGWYAGAVGWFDRHGDGTFSVAIRSGLIEEREAWLYAGAGIVSGSDPAREYAETTLKQAPLISALGVQA